MSIFITFWTSVVNLVCFPLHLIRAFGWDGRYRRVTYPQWLSQFTDTYNQRMHDRKRDLFSNLSHFNRPGKLLTLLEIGCGTGANFQFYPTGSRVICTDPSPHFGKFLTHSIEKNDHLTYGKFVVASAEDLGAVADGSVDVVVCTLVLCTVTDVQQSLREVLRVLRPGGAFFFLEHVAAAPSSWSYFFQHVLQPAWFYFQDGCETTRKTWRSLETAGFSELNLRHIEAPLPHLVKPHIMGYAVK